MDERVFTKEEIYGKPLDGFFDYIGKRIKNLDGNDVEGLYMAVQEAKIEMLDENYASLAERNVDLDDYEQSLAVAVSETREKKRESLRRMREWIEESRKKERE